MLNFILFLFIVGFASWAFKFVGAIVEMLLIYPFFGRGSEGAANSIEKRPKLFFTALIIKNVILGIGNAIMIFWVTAWFLQENGGNFWLYLIFSIIWSLTIITHYSAFPVMFFFSSTVTLLLFWLGFGALAWIITGFLTLVVSIAYYFGRINLIREHDLYSRFEL